MENYLFIAAAIAIIIVAPLIVIAFIYLIIVLKDVRKITKAIKETIAVLTRPFKIFQRSGKNSKKQNSEYEK